MDYRERRKIECQKLFQGFHPDVSKSRNPQEVQLCAEMAADGYFSYEIAEEIGKTSKAVQKIFRRFDFPPLYNFCPPLEEERPNWINGIKDCHGYAYKRSKGHPRGTKHGSYVAVHRLVMEEHLGRFLTGVEVVDHIDGNPQNNNIENLRVFPNNAEHLRVTLRGRCPNWSEEGKKALDKSRRRRTVEKQKASLK